MNKMITIKKLIEKNLKEFIEWREYLHKNPELSWEEFGTSAFIKSKLDSWGLSYQEVGTGLYGDIVFSNDGEHIGYRADIDALPINDEKTVLYKSQKNGLCHACGHDFHTVSLLGTIRILLELKGQLRGKFRFIFQAAEEVIPGGSLKMIEAGVLDGLDKLFAMHAEPSLNCGDLSIVPDWVTTKIINCYLRVKGKGGHSARPHQSIDPIFTASQLITNLYGRIDRFKKYDEYFVFTITKIKAGERLNIIPDYCDLSGSLRITNEEHEKSILNFINSSVKVIADSFSASVEIRYEFGNPPVVNDKDLAVSVSEILKRAKLFKKIHDDVRTMGSEDFSNYQHYLPSCYIRFGTSNKNLKHGLHSSLFDIDSKSIGLAVEMFVTITTSFLKKEK